jgi:PAS domain-containing protein
MEALAKGALSAQPMRADREKEGGPRSRRRSVDPAVRALQIDELFRFAGTAAIFSFLGAVLTLGVLWDTNDLGRGTVWFFWATAVTFLRVVVITGYKRRQLGADPESWVRLLIAANALAGMQWGLLGTVLFPVEPGYRQLFTIMVITCFVGGSLSAYCYVRGAHEAFSLPAIVPPAIYLFFVQDGQHWFAGITALFFCFAILYYSYKMHRHMEERFALQVAHTDLLTLTGGVAERLAIENRELAHRVAVRGASTEAVRDASERLYALFLRSPLPMLECDADAKVVTCNPAAERLLGEREGDLVGRPLQQHLATVGRTRWEKGGPDSFLGSSESSMHEIEVLAHGVRVARTVASFTRLPAAEGLRPGFGVIVAAPPR